jgi:hypothetical protein
MQSLMAFIRSFGRWWWVIVVDYIFGIVGVYQTVTGETTLSKILWGLVFFLAFIIPSFIAFHKMRIKSDKVTRELDDIKNSCPNVELADVKNVRVKIRNVLTGDVLGEPYISYISFSNNPKTLLQSKDAYNVVGYMDIYKESGQRLYNDIIGRWSETKEETSGGLPTEMEQIIIPANGRPNPMDAVLKYNQDQNCYVQSNAGRRRAPADWRDKDGELPVGNYFIKVHIRGTLIDKTFWLKLVNKGQGTQIGLESLSYFPSVVDILNSQSG